jgi:hypothetical protein
VTRAGTTMRYWWGSSISAGQADYNSNKTLSVHFFQPNRWGLYQVHGNVWEWTEDCWHGNYNEAPMATSPMRRAGPVHCGSAVGQFERLGSRRRLGCLVLIIDSTCAIGDLATTRLLADQEIRPPWRRPTRSGERPRIWLSNSRGHKRSTAVQGRQSEIRLLSR